MPSPQSVPDLPDDIAALLRQHVPSLHQLEILLHVYGQESRRWTAAAVAQALYLPPELATDRLADLHARGLMSMTPTADGAPEYQALLAHANLIGRLAQFYATRRVTIISFIFAQPNETVRSFADAFKLRKEP